MSYTLASGALPPGLTLSSAGLISGTPTTAGTFSFTIGATDSCLPTTQNAQHKFSLTVHSAPITMNVTPPSFGIPFNTASSQNVAYSFSSAPSTNITLNSDKGVFVVANTVVGEDNIPLSVSISQGSGIVFEVLTIPVAISQRAVNLGTTKIIYRRTFSSGSVSLTGQIDITVTTEAGASFAITGIQLYFENRSAQITVKRTQPLTKVYANIKFNGSGLLQGYWEVDGRILFNVNEHITYGVDVILELPGVISLPTYDIGTHTIRFVITNPLPSIPIPEAIYFVTSEEFKEIVPIKLISPGNGSEVHYSSIEFVWEGRVPVPVYLIEYMEKGGDKPFFSAYTKKSQYKVPTRVLKSSFSPGKNYLWRVKGLNSEGNISTESPVYEFTFK